MNTLDTVNTLNTTTVTTLDTTTINDFVATFPKLEINSTFFPVPGTPQDCNALLKSLDNIAAGMKDSHANYPTHPTYICVSTQAEIGLLTENESKNAVLIEALKAVKRGIAASILTLRGEYDTDADLDTNSPALTTDARRANPAIELLDDADFALVLHTYRLTVLASIRSYYKEQLIKLAIKAIPQIFNSECFPPPADIGLYADLLELLETTVNTPDKQPVCLRLGETRIDMLLSAGATAGYLAQLTELGTLLTTGIEKCLTLAGVSPDVDSWGYRGYFTYRAVAEVQELLDTCDQLCSADFYLDILAIRRQELLELMLEHYTCLERKELAATDSTDATD